MERTKFKIIITAIIIAVISFSSMAFSADNLKKAEIKFSTISLEDKAKIETITLLLKGVSEANVSADNKTFEVLYNPSEISSNMILFAISSLGYNGSLVKETEVVSYE